MQDTDLFLSMAEIARTPENHAVLADTIATVPPAMTALVMGPTVWVPVVLLVLALALVVLGPFPSQEQALYLTAVALGLFMGALGLFVSVFWRRRVPEKGVPSLTVMSSTCQRASRR